jgi:hypothetical protein
MLYELLFDVIVSDFEGEFGELVWGVADGEEGVSSGERHLTSSFGEMFVCRKGVQASLFRLAAADILSLLWDENCNSDDE